MREIKFRAWDKSRNEYLSAGNMFISVNPGSRPLNSFVYLDLIDRPDAYKSRFILEQYTGLRDKNGTEIYEGDIILAGHYKWKCKVVWDEKCARFIGLTNDKDVKIVYVDMVDKNDESAVEVVGNIFSNPGLLNSEN